MKSESFVEVTVDESAGTVGWSFENGEVVVIAIDELTPEMQRAAMLHGLKQKGTDTYAGAKDKAAVERMTKADWAYRECEATIANIRDNSAWNRKAASGLTVRILAEALGMELAEAQALWNSWDPETTVGKSKRKAARNHDTFKEIKLRLAREALAAKKAGPSLEDVIGLSDEDEDDDAEEQEPISGTIEGGEAA